MAHRGWNDLHTIPPMRFSITNPDGVRTAWTEIVMFEDRDGQEVAGYFWVHHFLQKPDSVLSWSLPTAAKWRHLDKSESGTVRYSGITPA